ncbi:MAG: hypothetical protein QGG88_07170 [Gammaproteobacteria bacterium]|jgi:hypothetical protein|nr:hypothetical protein [Gammaproteobacteria bacterium]
MPKKFALTLLFISGGLMLIERATMLVSQAAGKLYCGADYMQPVEGYIGTMSCGFNSDIYVTIALFSIMFIGMFGFLFGAMRATPEDQQD